MITGFFLTILYTIVSFLISFLPEIQYPQEITDAVMYFWGTMQSFSWLFPMDTLVTILGLATIYFMSSLIWKMGNFIFRYLRGD